MTKAFKFFNVLQIILFAVLALGALMTTIYMAYICFELAFLEGVVKFIVETVSFVPAAFFTGTLDVLLELVPALAEFAQWVMLALPALLFVWLLVLIIRMCRPAKHYAKIHGITFAINIVFAILMAVNAYALSELAFNGSSAALYAFIINVVFVLMAIYYIIMNICGRKQIAHKEDVAADYFGPNQGGGFGAPRAQRPQSAPQPSVRPQAPPSVPPRRPPPPPPRA